MASKIINLSELSDVHRILDALLPEPDDGSEEAAEDDETRAPPLHNSSMFPGLLGEIVRACCQNSESVPVAVAAHVMIRFVSLLGHKVFLRIGDEKRRLNEFFLMIGASGLGKGGSSHSPRVIFEHVEEMLAFDFMNQVKSGVNPRGMTEYQFLKVHNGGLSSGEGVAAALDDNAEPAITDKRMLIFEPEFSNVLTMAQRTGNTLSMIIRNAYDGTDIKPLTKRDRVCVTDPFICLLANITDMELKKMDQNNLMAANGMLNRFLILWQQPMKEVAFPDPLPDNIVEQLSQQIFDCLMFASHRNHDHHYKKIRQSAQEIVLSDSAKSCWTEHYRQIINHPDTDIVRVLTRRYRLHALLIASILALLDRRLQVEESDIVAAMSWLDYSRESIVYVYGMIGAQKRAKTLYQMAKKILLAVFVLNEKQEFTTRTDIHNFLQRKAKAADISAALEILMLWIPPLIRQDKTLMKSGKTVSTYRAILEEYL